MWQRVFMIMLCGVASGAPGGVEAQSPNPGRTELSWLAYGDLRGNLEPCGCDPATDLGGVQRLAGVIRRERLASARLQLFDLGNLFPDTKKSSDLKSPFLLRAAYALEPTAILVNQLEWARASWLRTSLKTLRLKSRYVLSNAKRPAAWYQEMITATGVVVMGYLGSEHSGALAAMNQALTKKWAQMLNEKASKKATKVLLFSGTDTDLQHILAAKLFDLVISSNTKSMSAPLDKEERDDEGLLVRLSSPHPVLMVPVGGQGILRGGPLRARATPSISDFLDGGVLGGGQDCPGVASHVSPVTPARPSDRRECQAWPQAHIVTWLSPTVQGEDLSDLMREYDAKTKAEFADRVHQRVADLATSPFAGASACQGCHQQEYAVWQASAHAHAMDTLIKKGKGQDSECVACHVVGHIVRGGFVSMDKSPHFAGVQCENCHGPAKAHTQDSSVRPIAPQGDPKQCAVCHHNPHSPSFDFDKYWSAIKH